MNPENNKFKIILTAIFGILVLVGIVTFATFRSSDSKNQQVEILVWGTMKQSVFNSYIEKLRQDRNVEFKLQYTEKNINTIDAELVEAIATGRAPDAILIPHELEKRYLDKVYFLTSISVRNFTDTY